MVLDLALKPLIKCLTCVPTVATDTSFNTGVPNERRMCMSDADEYDIKPVLCTFVAKTSIQVKLTSLYSFSHTHGGELAFLSFIRCRKPAQILGQPDKRSGEHLRNPTLEYRWNEFAIHPVLHTFQPVPKETGPTSRNDFASCSKRLGHPHYGSCNFGARYRRT
jgi:hypothetical protein